MEPSVYSFQCPGCGCPIEQTPMTLSVDPSADDFTRAINRIRLDVSIKHMGPLFENPCINFMQIFAVEVQDMINSSVRGFIEREEVAKKTDAIVRSDP